MMQPTTDMLSHALSYARMGWPMFPCHTVRDGACSCGDPKCGNPGKHPIGELVPHGFKNASAEPEVIRDWWTRWPDANIGFAVPESIVVVDLDHKPDKDGKETLKALMEQYSGNMPNTVSAKTGSGGLHAYYMADALYKCKNGVFPGIDIKTKGGYVILPPSVHISGGRYEWLATPGRSTMAELPTWFGALLPKAGQSAAPSTITQAAMEKVNEGARNDTLFRLAASLRERGLSESEILAALLVVNAERCEPPLQESDVRTIAHSAGKYQQGKLRDRSPNAPLPPPPDAQTALRSFSEVDYEDPKWLMRPYIPLGKYTLIQGDSGVGKTALSCSLAAHVSTGKPLLGNTIEAPGAVLLISVEDDAPTLRGRIEACGGDISKCFFLENPAGLTFTDIAVEQAVKQVGAKMVIFDPLQAFLGGRIDMHRANETRPVLAALAEMAKRNDCAAVIISHMSKGTVGGKAIYRALGSVDIIAASRSALYVGRNPKNEDECVMVHIKSSNARKGLSIAYTIGEYGGVAWQRYSNLTIEELEVAAKRKERGVEYEDEPIVIGVRKFIAENPKGGKLTYEEFHTLCVTASGIAPYADNREGAYKIPVLKAEIMMRDKILVETGIYVRRNKGLSIFPYISPTSFQMSYATEG